MAWFAKLLKNRQLVIALGFIFLLVLIWAIKILVDGSSMVALVATLLLLAAWITLLFIEQARAKRGAAQLAQSLKTHADDQLLGIRPEMREELERLQRDFVAAIDKIKSSELGKGLKGNKALYALPWYMVIGPFGSGKTTAIKNSGLEFPLGIDKEVKGVGGTRNCDWWFTDSAILLDTSGRYTSEEEDRDKWLTFLDLLKKHRRKEPINGVLVGISLPDLMKASPDDIEWHAQNVRKRIDEVIDRLNVICPVYIVFTKCDLLTGFVDFFKDLNPEQCHQVLGCPLTKAQQVNIQPRALFEQEFQALTDALLDYRLERLSKLAQSDPTSPIYVFPIEFAAAKENLANFIGKLFQTSKFQKTLFFRGFYFTSGTQEGIPEDFVMRPIADAFNLAPERKLGFNPDIGTKSYFVKKLFTDHIIPDRHLVTRTSRFAANERWLRLAIHAGMAVLLLLFIFGLWNAYDNSKDRLENLKQVASELNKVQWEDSARRPNYFQALERYRQQMVSLETHAESARLRSLWMDRSRSVLPAAYGLYLKKMEPFIKERAYNELEERLRQALTRHGSLTDKKSDTVYDDLHAYLLFNQCRAELADTTRRNFLGRQLSEVLRLNADETNLKNLAHAQIRYFARGWAFVNTHSGNGLADAAQFSADDGLVDKVRLELLTAKQPTAENFYRRIKRDARVKFASLSVSSVLQQTGSGLLNNPPEAALDGIFTVNAWKTFMKDFIEDKKWDTGPDCVMGNTKQFSADEVQDKDAMAQSIEKLYFQDYADSWRRFLGGVDYQTFGNISQAIKSLELLGDATNSPILRLLQRANDETQFENLLQRKTELLGGHSIDQQFADLHWLFNGKDGQTALSSMISQFKSIGNALRSLKDDDKMAKDYAATLLNKPDAGDLPNAQKAINEAFSSMLGPSNDTRDTLRTLFERPLQLTWEAILVPTQEYLNTAWRDRVFDVNPLKSGFAWQEMAGFFKQGGAFWKFFDMELAPFVERDTWQLNPWQKRGIQISPETREALIQAAKLRDGLASGGEAGISFSMKAQPPGKPKGFPNFDQLCIEIGASGDKNRYCFKRNESNLDWNVLSWPGPDKAKGASLKLIDKPSWTSGVLGKGSKVVAELEEPGELGWIRLFNRAAKNGNLYQWTLSAKEDKSKKIVVSYQIRFDGTKNPFALGNFSFKPTDKLN